MLGNPCQILGRDVELLVRTRLPQLLNKLANYDLPTIFRRFGHQIVDWLADYCRADPARRTASG